MNLARKNKIAIVNDLTKKFENCSSMLVFTYSGLTVSNIQELRSQLFEKNVHLKVYKNRLVKLAAKKTGHEKLNEYLIGQNIFAFSEDDALAPTKIVYDFAKNHKSIKLIAGIYENNIVDNAQLLEMAKLPSMEEALIVLARSLMNPLFSLSLGLNMLTEKHDSQIAEAKSESKEESKEEVEIQTASNTNNKMEYKEEIEKATSKEIKDGEAN